MAKLNTPLINELLVSVCQHPDFEAWRHKGKVPTGTIKELCEPLKTDPRFVEQPLRFYTSAINTVSYTYKSWLKLQKRLQLQLERKTHWLEMFKSDAELIEESEGTLDSIRNKASEILAQLTPKSTNIEKHKKGYLDKNPKKSKDDKSLVLVLFDAYDNTEDTLTRSAISYLIKNGCKVTDKEEDAEKFIKRQRKLEIQIQRLTEQLEARIPKGRDLTDDEWQKNLILATDQVPKNEAEAKSWQNALLRKSNSVPFPVTYETSEDMIWSKNEKGRICVRFGSIIEHTFEIYCDNRQLHWFKRFLSDQEVKKNSKNQHTSSLFTLRSGRISWQEGQGKGEPWNIHHLILYCTVDTRLWTAEGTRLVAQEKAEEITKIITKTKEKGQLNNNQLAFIKRKNTTLARINNTYPRPSKPLYKGQSHILLGVSLGLEKPATVAVVDMISGKVLTYRSIKQLLDNNYRLLNRRRQQKKALSHKRKVAQTQAAPNQYGDSELGEYIDRLLAKEIVAIAQKYSAGSIALPKLEGMREQINSEIHAKAEEKCPESIEAQKKYAKQYRRSVNQWSYGRLIENINSQAAQAGIVIEETKQCVKGSPQDKAKEIALAAYKSRNKS